MQSSTRTALLLSALTAVTAWVAYAGPLSPPAGPVASSYRTLDQVTPTWDRVLPAAERFVLVMNGEGVLDRETGLVWEQSLTTNFLTHSNAVAAAYDKVVGGRKGWRLPSVEELLTLVDPTQPPPRLPAGHPFTPHPASGFQSFWTSTKVVFNPDRIYQVDFTPGAAVDTTTLNQGQVWLVRGGSYSQPRP